MCEPIRNRGNLRSCEPPRCLEAKNIKTKLKLKYPDIQFRYALFLETCGYGREENRNIEYIDWINSHSERFEKETGKKAINNQVEFDEFLLESVIGRRCNDAISSRDR